MVRNIYMIHLIQYFKKYCKVGHRKQKQTNISFFLLVSNFKNEG